MDCTFLELNTGIMSEHFKDFLKKYSYHPAILLEIKHLEKLSDITYTEQERMFRGGKLRGFWHKHYADGSIKNKCQNILNIQKLKHQNSRKFQQLAWEESKNYESHDILGFSSGIAEKMIQSYYEARSKSKLTGEWIIFAKYNKKNYYLTLASHEENGNLIYERIKKYCFSEYPFLF